MTDEVMKKKVEAAIGSTLTSEQENRLSHLLETAKQAFLYEAKIKTGTGKITQTLRARGRLVTLRQPGVTQIHSVAVEGVALDYRWDERLPKRVMLRKPAEFIDIEFSFNYQLPEVATQRLVEIVVRALMTPLAARQGMGQFSVTKGPFTESGTFKDWAVGGQVLLSPEDKRLARSLGGVSAGKTIGLEP